MKKIAVVMTSIASPNKVMTEIAQECQKRKYHFILIGDESSPPEFHLDGCDFYDLKRQRDLGFELVRLCPTRHYTRKNIGYLIALSQGVEIIIEIDDDNFPLEGFWDECGSEVSVKVIDHAGWVNVYRYFADGLAWPRGFGLSQIHQAIPPYDGLDEKTMVCPIQQGLVDGDPDVDAIYRLIFPLDVAFKKDRKIALKYSWCPFNSQNTTWWATVFPLMYLPAYCTFRMTDIWRSFVAQRIVWANDWSVLFKSPTACQIRNEHDLMKDFKDEVPGYLTNEKLCDLLMSLAIKPGVDNLPENLYLAYERLVSENIFPEKELVVLKAWLEGIRQLIH